MTSAAAKRAEPRGGAMILAARQPDEKARREQITGTGNIGDLLDRLRRYRLDGIARHNHAAFLAARHHRELGLAAQRFHRAVEIGCLVEAVQLASRWKI